VVVGIETRRLIAGKGADVMDAHGGTGWLPLTFPAAGVRGMFRIAEVLKFR
jgi:hypothetical protein